MTPGEKLLNLTVEYQQAVASGDWPQYGSEAVRSPEVIAEEYGEALRAFIAN